MIAAKADLLNKEAAFKENQAKEKAAAAKKRYEEAYGEAKAAQEAADRARADGEAWTRTMPGDIVDRTRPGPVSEYHEQVYHNFNQEDPNFEHVDYDGNHAPAGSYFKYAIPQLSEDE